MKKIDIFKKKQYSKRVNLKPQKHYITNPKKLFRKNSGEKKINNTAFFSNKNQNIYLNNTINIFEYKENSKNDVPKEKIISPSKLFTKVKPYKSKSRKRPHTSSVRKLPVLSNNNAYPSFSPSNYLNMETEKLNQEKYQLNRLVKNLKQELLYLRRENEEKDELLKDKEQEINQIITNSNYIFGDEKKDDAADSRVIYTDDIIIQNNSAFNLYLKIKKEINKYNNEINEEEEKINNLKHSIYYTKMNENDIEGQILEDQINKINNLLDNALMIKENNGYQMKDFYNLNHKISVQNNIMVELSKKQKFLNEDKNFLEDKIKNIQINLTYNKDKMFKNKKEIKFLKRKNNILCNDQVVKSQVYVTKNNSNISINSLYLKKIAELKKIVNFYKNQNRYNETVIDKLKGQKKNLLDSIKLSNNNKLPSSFLSLKTNNKNDREIKNTLDKNEKENISLSKSNEENQINEYRNLYKKLKDEEKQLEEQYKECQEKLRQISEYIQQQNSNNNANEEEKGQNQIEFGIDENNPYYTDNENNQPEIQNKFTTSQFNQFTYILFKNFEAKGVVSEESKNKIINPFIKLAEDNKINMVRYPSDQFDFISEEYTKIILNSINSDNNFNHSLTRIFVSALLFNSGCLIQKLVDYFNILFSYTRNYINEEEKYLNKLRNKYKEEIRFLIHCLNNYIENDKKTKNYENAPIYFPLIKIKEIIEVNNINLKDKYVEFLFYYLKKFDDNQAKLDELKYSLLNDIVNESEKNNEMQNDNNDNNENKEDEYNKSGEKDETYKNIVIDNKKDDKDDDIIVDENLMNYDDNDNKENEKEKEDEDEEEDNNNKKDIDNNINENENKLILDDDKENHSTDKNNDNINDDNIDNIDINKEDKEDKEDKKYEEDKKYINKTEKKSENNSAMDESMTEITNEEYIKQLSDCIKLIKSGLTRKKISFDEFIREIKQEIEIENSIIECMTIDDFNEILKRIGIVFSDLKLSCLCSKYSLPNELRLIEIKKLREDINE